MAKRFVYVPAIGKPGVDELELEFQWFPGFAKSQKQKSINALHQEAKRSGIDQVLEISSKSLDEIGIQSSAFNLSFVTKSTNRLITVESAFQGSKVFAFSGPFPDLYEMSARDAKKEIRSRQRGPLTCFNFFGKEFPLKPRTFFYDWLYINTLQKNNELASKLCQYSGFSDIEFNPEKSLNCQAFSAALYVSLVKCGLLNKATESEKAFVDLLAPFYEQRERKLVFQNSLI